MKLMDVDQFLSGAYEIGSMVTPDHKDLPRQAINLRRVTIKASVVKSDMGSK